MIIKTLINYEDWLLLKRGNVEPMVGDKIKTIVQYIDETWTIDEFNFNPEIHQINNCFVEVEVETSDLKL